MNTPINIIGVETSYGASKTGAEKGANAIRENGLIEYLESSKERYVDLGNITADGEIKLQPKGCMKNLGLVNDTNKKLYKQALSSHVGGNFPIVLGGDHTVAVGSVLATATANRQIGLIWVDAHADFNDETSTETGNMHGMPCSCVCGYGPKKMASICDNPTFVNPCNCVLVGTRNIDREENVRLKQAGITVFNYDYVKKFGIKTVIKKAIDIATNGTRGIHLSFDIDSVNPELAMGTGVREEGGLTVEEAKTTIKAVASSGKLLAMDMVEVNPDLDENGKTAKLSAELIITAIKNKK